MTLPGFEIFVNGIPRSFRDQKEAAYEAGMNLKKRWPELAVVLKCVETGDVFTVRQDGRRDSS